MRKWLLFGLVASLLAAPAVAQQATRDGFGGLQYDVDSATLTYCTTSSARQGQQLIMSQGGGSSANLVPSVASSGPFLGLAVGDVLQIKTGESTYAWRVIVTFTSSNLVVVDSAITIAAGTSFQWFRNTCGTAATSGWFSIPAAAQRVSMSVVFEQGDITSLVARWECKHSHGAGSPIVVYPGETSDCGIGGTLSTDRCSWLAAQAGTATGTLTVVDEAPAYGACRVGLAWVGADASDAAANLEKVSVLVSVR